MRIAIVAHAHPAITSGGGEISAHRQFRHLREAGHDAVFVGTTFHPDQGAHLFSETQGVVTLGAGDFCVRGRGMDSFLMEHEDVDAEDRLLDLLLRLEAEAYHFHHFWNLGAGTIRRLRAARPAARMILTVHEFSAICANHGQMVRAGSNELCLEASPLACTGCFRDRTPFEFLLRAERLKRMIDVFDMVIAPSHFLRERFLAWGLAPDRIQVLENGIDLPVTTGPCDDQRTLERKSTRFAFFGQPTPTKGLDVLAEAAALLAGDPACRDISIDLHGVERAAFETLWPTRPIAPSLAFRGRYRPDGVTELMRGYGWLVVPSVWWENSPVILQEARAARTPVIASNIGGLAEKSAAFGILFPVGDAAGLAQAIAEVAGDADRLRTHQERITPPMTVARYTALWMQMCNLGQAASRQSPTRMTS